MEPSFLLPGLYLQAATMFFLIHMWGGKVFDTQSACSQLGPSTAMFCTPPQLPCSLTFSYLSLFCLFVIISIYAVSLVLGIWCCLVLGRVRCSYSFGIYSLLYFFIQKWTTMLLAVTSWLMINMAEPENGASQLYHLPVPNRVLE